MSEGKATVVIPAATAGEPQQHRLAGIMVPEGWAVIDRDGLVGRLLGESVSITARYDDSAEAAKQLADLAKQAEKEQRP